MNQEIEFLAEKEEIAKSILRDKSVSGELYFEIFDSVPPEIVMDLRPERGMMSMTFLSLLIHVIGSLETAANLICAREFENAVLIWPEKSTNITHNVQSRVWYKGEILVSWVNELGFKEGKDYEGRLRHVGDGNIEIKNVTRNDSGIYQSTSQFRGVSNTSTASVNLQVIDAPANTCKPVISREGSNLIAYIPSVDVCTTSKLRLKWIDTNKTVTTQNGTTILDLGTDSGGREYMVCAVGEATKCFQGNVSDFCTNYTYISQHQPGGDGVTLYDALFISPYAAAAFISIALIAVLAIIVIFLLRHKGIICKKAQREDDYRVRKIRRGHEVIMELRRGHEVIMELRRGHEVIMEPINIFVYDEQLPRRPSSAPAVIYTNICSHNN